MDRTVIEARLAVLESEFSAGRRQLAERQAQVEALREQLLRISGAVRVLSDLLAQAAAEQTPTAADTARCAG